MGTVVVVWCPAAWLGEIIPSNSGLTEIGLWRTLRMNDSLRHLVKLDVEALRGAFQRIKRLGIRHILTDHQ
jgi:hypothetical protein